MRVYFVGSHCTGKTTMARYVSKRYGLPMITEVARSVLSEIEADFTHLRTDLEAVGDYQDRVFHRQIEAETQHSGGFVSDRAFDNLAYAAEHSTRLAALVKKVDPYMSQVRTGTVFFLRPWPELLRADGIREPLEWSSVVRIDGMIKLLLELFEIPYLSINTPSMQERCRAVDFVLNRETRT